MKKRVGLCMIAILAASSLILINLASASVTTPSVPEFTLRNVAYPYDVPATTTSTTDPYTGKVTTTTTPGYHVENKTIEAIIKNPPGASYYNFRYKGHFEEKWKYDPFNPDSGVGYFLGDYFGVPFQASSSSITVLSLYFFQWLSIPENGTVDVQVQTLFGNFDAVPYGHVIDVGGPTYDFYFKGTTSDWSNTQTITIGANGRASSDTLPSQTNPQPDFSTTPTQNSTTSATDQSGNQTSPTLDQPTAQTSFYGIVVVTITVLAAGFGLLVYVKKRRRQPRVNAFCYETVRKQG
jgi:hypothetical protein